MNQVAKDKQLLDIAKDYFRFVTNFFEVIKVSATHIYHSALELCPVSSIVRRLYHHRRIACSPKVVIGSPDSWEPSITTSGNYQFCIWSPCGQFVAARTENAVEIRNQLTLEPITILQPTGMNPRLRGPLAYSPDGRFIACASYHTGIIIWDIQTGGVAEEIECGAYNISLVWSLDGGSICTIEPGRNLTFIVHAYKISSGTTSSPSTLRSSGDPYLWMDDNFFLIMTMRNTFDGIDIFEVGSTLTNIRSFDFSRLPGAAIRSFSPTTHRLSISGRNELRIFDIQNSKLLLDGRGYDSSNCFSSDGSLFAASLQGSVQIWKCASGRYTLWRKFQCGHLSSPLRFSPTPSSILGNLRDVLQVWRLHELPTTPNTHQQQHMGLSRSGTRLVTTDRNTVTIIDLLGRSPPQFIDTGVQIEGFALTGNVLLVAGFWEIVAWLLTEEGLVDGVIGDRRVGRGDSIWTTSKQELRMPRVEGQIGVIQDYGGVLRVYHTETGEVLNPTQAPQHYSGRRYYNNIPQCNTRPEDGWQTSRDTLLEGWVKDPEGKHRLWVPVEWRKDWDPADWHHDATTQFSYIGDRFVLVKF